MEKAKRFLFSLILAFGIVATRSIPCFASAYVIDPSTIGSIGDLGLGLLGGAEFDFTGSKYQIENYDSLSQADQVDAAIGATNQFIDDYWSARKEYIKANNGFLQETYKVYDNYALKNAGLLNTDTNFHISGQLATDWMQYSKFWYQDYISSLDLDPEVVQPTPDSAYQSLLNTINGDGFYFKNYPTSYQYRWGSGNNYYIFTLLDHPDNYSWMTQGSSYYYNNSTDMRMVSIPLSTINITSNNGTYSFSFTSSGVTSLYRYEASGTKSAEGCVVAFYNTGSHSGGYFSDNWTRYNNVTFSSSGSLSDVLTYISKRFRNITIYVDNVLWAIAGSPQILNPVIPDFPDVIGTDEDPIYTFDLPDTSNYEGAFDITSMFDAIKEAIIGASDSDNTTSGILTGENVSDLVVDDTGTLVGTKAVPISTVLDDSIEGQATKRLPNIELYPDKIHDAFSGTSLLADVVLATQESLPSAIITVFWGIVICLFIIALIKSLHR